MGSEMCIRDRASPDTVRGNTSNLYAQRERRLGLVEEHRRTREYWRRAGLTPAEAAREDLREALVARQLAAVEAAKEARTA